MKQMEFARQLRRNMTDAEHVLWKHLRAHRVNGQKFRRQQLLGPYIVDFVHFGARLIIEADGGQHNGSEQDAVRDAWLESQGFHSEGNRSSARCNLEHAGYRGLITT